MDSLTVRQQLNRDKKVYGGGAFLGFVGMMVGILIYRDPQLALIGFVIAFLSHILGWIFIRCPRCKTTWGRIAMGGRILSIDPKIAVCPFCRAELDLPAGHPDQPEV